MYKVTNKTNRLLKIDGHEGSLAPRESIQVQTITGSLLRLKHVRMVTITQVKEQFIEETSIEKKIERSPELLGDTLIGEVSKETTKTPERSKRSRRKRNNNTKVINDSVVEESSGK